MQLTHNQPQNCIVIWGNGSFGPTSRGHAPAPNKKLRRALAAHGVYIVLSDEYGTSKNTACCHCESCYSYQSESISKSRQERLDKLAAAGVPIKPSTKHQVRGLLYCHAGGNGSNMPTNPYKYPNDSHRDNGHTTIQTGSINQPSSHEHSRPWNRDISAAINIMSVAYGRAHRCLAKCFRRPKNGT